MPPLAWLLVAIAAGVVAFWLAVPAWRIQRERAERDLNAERYLAWRGRAAPPAATARGGMPADVRRRLYAGGGLAAVALAALIAFFATS